MSIFDVGDGLFWPSKGTGGLKHHVFLFLMENSILKISGSVDVKSFTFVLKGKAFTNHFEKWIFKDLGI